MRALFLSPFRLHLAAALALLSYSVSVRAAGADYAMYVWTIGFDSTVPGCDEAKLLAWDADADPECYTHNWESEMARQWLWDTANRPGREIGRLFLSDVKNRLEDAHAARDCSDPDVSILKNLLSDGHCRVPGVKLHALFAASDVEVSEQGHIKFVVWYNDTCADSPAQRFDGVAINNEAWNEVKCTTSTAETDYLDDLQTIADEAALQVNGTLTTHYSIGWPWSYCDDAEVSVDWHGTVQAATLHMIDVFDSVDVQVAFVTAAAVAERAIIAGYDHAIAQGKPFYVLSYTNKTALADCVTTHFPYTCDAAWSNSTRTDDYLMQEVFDTFPVRGIPEALAGIHYFRGVYSTGGHVDWPSYYSGSIEPCRSGELEGSVELSGPNHEDISWPPQENASSYEVARAADPLFEVDCRIVATTPTTSTVDPELPGIGTVFYYLVRIGALGPGTWGEASTGEPRQFECP